MIDIAVPLDADRVLEIIEQAIDELDEKLGWHTVLIDNLGKISCQV
jgi:hypothetical protein